jgi:N-methylhydantoinase B
MTDARDGRVVARADADAVRLRDLSETAFFERYACDRFTATVLSNRFAYVIDNIKDQLIRTAFSAIVRVSDFAAGLSGPSSYGWPMVAVSQTVPNHVGSIPDAVRVTLEEYGLNRLQSGDLITCNDYFRVGTHLNDVVFIRPLIIGGELLGALTLRCHQMDMGGITPGGFTVSKRDRYEDGLAVPPVKLFAQGEPVPEMVKLFMANTREGPLLYNEMHTIYACLNMGETLIQESIDKYGRDAYLGAIRYTDDVSAETMQLALEALPDGVYEGEEILDSDFLPQSPPYRIRMRVNKRGGRAEVDLSGSSVATRSALNSAWPDARTGIVLGFKCLIDRYSRYTSGSMRPIDVVLPPNSIINPDYPHACQYYHLIVITMIAAVFNTLNPALGEEAVAHDGGGWSSLGVSRITEDGMAERPYSGAYKLGQSDSSGNAPWGGSRLGDGLSSHDPVPYNIRPERDEAVYDAGHVPLSAVTVSCGYMPDTAGPGKYRGGVGTYCDVKWLVPTTQSSANPRTTRPAPGVNGGRPGRLGASWVWRSDEVTIDADHPLPETMHDPIYRRAIPVLGVLDPSTQEVDLDGRYYNSETPIPVPAGSVVRSVSHGAGGWGDPLTRDPALVLRDVRDGYVTINGALIDYGVIVYGDPHSDPEGLIIDAIATAKTRTQRTCHPTLTPSPDGHSGLSD